MSSQNPTAAGLAVSTTIKAVLVAVAALGWIPLDTEQITLVAVAVTAVVDLAVFLGWVKPRVDEQVATALAQPPETPTPVQ